MRNYREEWAEGEIEASALLDAIDELRVKIKAMEQQEPVAWLHESRRDSDVVTDAVKHVWGKAVVGSLAAYSIPLYLAPGAQPAPSALAESITADMQAQHDSELITENDSGEALIRLDGAIAAVEDNFALAQPAPKAVAYLDLGVGGYMDIGTDLTDEALAAIPKGRHMLGIVGTYGVEGYSPAQPTPSVPVDILYRLGAAHDVCLDGDHRACRDAITQLMCEIGPDGAVPEPKS